jgi:hypothetical protein
MGAPQKKSFYFQNRGVPTLFQGGICRTELGKPAQGR